MAVQSIEGASALPLALSVIPSLPRPVLARLVARMIDRLDEMDGDPDREEMDAEDSFVLSWYASGVEGPGCPISDPGGDPLDDGELDEAEYGVHGVYGLDQTQTPILPGYLRRAA